MKAIVGLGNPGSRYRGTRHNVGFEVLNRLAERLHATRPRAAFEGELAEAQYGGTTVLLAAPATFMNQSGRCVRRLIDYYQLPLAELLVVCDDLALPLEKLRLRSRGSSGGHKGLRDIIAHLGTQEFARLRVGVGQPPPEWDAADWVLSRFSSVERRLIEESIGRAAEAAEVWLSDGIDVAMNRYN